MPEAWPPSPPGGLVAGFGSLSGGPELAKGGDCLGPQRVSSAAIKLPSKPTENGKGSASGSGNGDGSGNAAGRAVESRSATEPNDAATRLDHGTAPPRSARSVLAQRSSKSSCAPDPVSSFMQTRSAEAARSPKEGGDRRRLGGARELTPPRRRAPVRCVTERSIRQGAVAPPTERPNSARSVEPRLSHRHAAPPPFSRLSRFSKFWSARPGRRP
jgi:hypothetical protein